MVDGSEITVLVVDDHDVVREGVRLALLRSPNIRIVGEAANGEAAVTLVERRRPDVVVMDLRMPQMDGIEATEEIIRRAPETKVLIFTAYSERALLQRGLESGVCGYILKGATHEQLLTAIEKVAAGEAYVDLALVPALANRVGVETSSRHASERSFNSSPTECRTLTSLHDSSSLGGL